MSSTEDTRRIYEKLLRDKGLAKNRYDFGGKGRGPEPEEQAVCTTEKGLWTDTHNIISQEDWLMGEQTAMQDNTVMHDHSPRRSKAP
ncbi:MAG: hypothetical protein IKY46_02430, partial [Clostridia bacterium]|nr:hypothetical protein [Clostridia bacterium]